MINIHPTEALKLMNYYDFNLFNNANRLLNVEFLETLKDSLSMQLNLELQANQRLIHEMMTSKIEKTDNSRQNSIYRTTHSEEKDSNHEPVMIKKEPTSEREIVSMQSKMKNDTKNIPKNYGKAILSYVQKSTHRVKRLLAKHGVSFGEFMAQVRRNKAKINSIADLRAIWG